MKNKRGITLIALVITIIILLILAGITITSITNSGLLEKAKEAKKLYEEAQNEEDEMLQKYETLIANRNSNTNKSNQYGYFVYKSLANRFGLYKFDELSSRSMDMRVCEKNGINTIVLEKGITYNINFSIRPYCQNTFQFEYGLYDINENKFIISDSRKDNISWCNFSYQQIYTPTENKYLVYACNLQGSGEEYIECVNLTITSQTKNIASVEFNSVNVSDSNYLTIKKTDATLEHTNTAITLEGNKTYKLTYQITIDPGNGYGNYGLWNFTDDCSIYCQYWTCVEEKDNKNVEETYSVIYTPTKDTQIGLYSKVDGGVADAKILDGAILKIECIE